MCSNLITVPMHGLLFFILANCMLQPKQVLCIECSEDSGESQCAGIDYNQGAFTPATCNSCDEAQYVDQILKKCVDCPENSKTYNVPAQQIAVTDCYCNAGYYLPPDAAPTDQCVACDIGFYKSDLSDKACDACTDIADMSSTTATVASTSWSDCQCNPGYYQVAVESNSVMPTTACTLCEAGKLKIDIGNPIALCQTCPRNSYCPYDTIDALQCPNDATSDAGSTQLEDCICPAGAYNAITAETYCVLCEAGTFKASSGQEACTNCDAGEYNPDIGSIECIACPGDSASVSSAEPFTSVTDCFCVAGYEHIAHMSGQSDIHTTEDTCTACAAGKYRSDAMIQGGSLDVEDYEFSCQSCPKNTYQHSEGGMSCFQCPDQMTTFEQTGQITCFCPLGYAQDHDSTLTLEFARCTACVAGKFNNEIGASVCTPCAPGHVSNAAAEQCDACAPGKYQSGLICIDCENGKYTANEASTQCDDCPANSGHLLQAQISVDACLCNVGFGTVSDSSACIACAAGTYKDTQSNVLCTSCPDNAYSDAQSIDVEMCFCNTGFQANQLQSWTEADGTQVRTQVHSRKFLSVTASCEQCPPGYFCGPDIIQPAFDTEPKRIGFAKCRQDSTSLPESDDFTACKCNAGYYLDTLAPEPDMSVPCSLCKSDSLNEGFYCPQNDDEYYSCGENTAVHSQATDSQATDVAPAASVPSDCICLQGYWRNCIDDPNSENPLHGIKHILDEQQQLTGASEACTRNDLYFTSNCVQCPSDTVCQLEQFMQHCPLHSTSPIGSDVPNDCKCNPGYKPVPSV